MLEREFPVDNVAYPWGTEVGTVEAVRVVERDDE
jgi:hypothetical protein